MLEALVKDSFLVAICLKGLRGNRANWIFNSLNVSTDRMN